MNKYFANYKQSLALKELGFDEPCFGFYNHQGELILMAQKDESTIETYKNSYVKLGMQYAAPLKSQVFEWFRDNYDLDCSIDKGGKKGIYHAFVSGSEHGFLYGNNGNNRSEFSYEEAEFECIKKLIELIKQKQ
jgi:hypothetical protein